MKELSLATSNDRDISLKELFQRHKLSLIFVIFCSLYVSSLYIAEYVLIDDSMYYESYGDLLNDNEIRDLIVANDNYKIVYSLTTVVFFIIKFVTLSLFTVSAQFFLFNRSDLKPISISFVEAELIFLFPIVVKIIWFSSITTQSYSLQDIAMYNPLSLSSLIELDDTMKYLLYVLQTCSLFEVIYLFFLAHRFSHNCVISYLDGLKLVLTGYIPALLLWFLLYVFLLNLAT